MLNLVSHCSTIGIDYETIPSLAQPQIDSLKKIALAFTEENSTWRSDPEYSLEALKILKVQRYEFELTQEQRDKLNDFAINDIIRPNLKKKNITESQTKTALEMLKILELNLQMPGNTVVGKTTISAAQRAWLNDRYGCVRGS